MLKTINDVTVILTNYKRPLNVIAIIKALENIALLWIVNNNPDVKIRENKSIERVINNDKNKLCIDRWRWAVEIPTKYVCILDDDVLPNLSAMKKLKSYASSYSNSIVGMIGYSDVKNSNCYSKLQRYYRVNAEVDFCTVGICMTRTENIKNIYTKYLENWEYPGRGDDIQVCFALSHLYNCKHYVVDIKIDELPEGDVGLCKNPFHEIIRWKLIKDWKESKCLRF